MSQTASIKRRIELVSCSNGEPVSEDFRMEQVAVLGIADGEVLLRSLYLP
jgi:NADPH-dependent curcumin reductase CurA